MTIIGIDVETSGLDATGEKFILGCITNEDLKSKIFYSKEEMWNYIVELGKKEIKRKKVLTVYAHNTNYDFWNIYPRKDKNIKFFAHIPFIAEYQLEKGKINFLDTYSIFRMNLQKLGEIIHHEKWETPERLKTNENIKPSDMKEIEKYCIRDTEIVVKSILTLKKELKEKGLNIKRLVTISQIAIQYFIKEMQKKERKYFFYNKDRGMVHFPKNRIIIHEAYRGGRVEAFKTGIIKNLKYVDCNNLYGFSAMNIKFPDLTTETEIRNPLNGYTQEHILDQIGVSEAILINKENEIGLIPIRMQNQSYYPKKDKIIIGTYTHQELKKAIQEGYKIIKIRKTVIWQEAEENPYQTIIPKLYEHRMKSKDKLEYYLYKQIMNASFGKLAQTRTNQEFLIDTVEKAEEYIKMGYDMWKGIGLNYLYRKTDVPSKPKAYYCPIIPTLINAQARIYMYDQFKKIGKNNLIYTDTDSIVYHDKKQIEDVLGLNIGQFKTEHEKANAIIWGKKSYSIGNDIRLSGIHKAQIKPEDFEKGYIKTQKMITMAHTPDIMEVGKFKTEERDLILQKEKHETIQQMLQENEFFVDIGIKDITYYMDTIKKIIERMNI